MRNSSIVFKKTLADAAHIRYQLEADRFYCWNGKKTFSCYDFYSGKCIESRTIPFHTEIEGADAFIDNWMDEFVQTTEFANEFEMKDELTEAVDEASLPEGEIE